MYKIRCVTLYEFIWDLFWTNQKVNPVMTHIQNPLDQGAMSCVSTLATVCATTLNHAPPHRPRGLQRIPDKAPHFTEVVRSSSYIRVILHHPQCTIHFPTHFYTFILIFYTDLSIGVLSCMYPPFVLMDRKLINKETGNINPNQWDLIWSICALITIIMVLYVHMFMTCYNCKPNI